MPQLTHILSLPITMKKTYDSQLRSSIHVTDAIPASCVQSAIAISTVDSTIPTRHSEGPQFQMALFKRTLTPTLLTLTLYLRGSYGIWRSNTLQCGIYCLWIPQSSVSDLDTVRFIARVILWFVIRLLQLGHAGFRSHFSNDYIYISLVRVCCDWCKSLLTVMLFTDSVKYFF